MMMRVRACIDWSLLVLMDYCGVHDTLILFLLVSEACARRGSKRSRIFLCRIHAPYIPICELRACRSLLRIAESSLTFRLLSRKMIVSGCSAKTVPANLPCFALLPAIYLLMLGRSKFSTMTPYNQLSDYCLSNRLLRRLKQWKTSWKPPSLPYGLRFAKSTTPPKLLLTVLTKRLPWCGTPKRWTVRNVSPLG